MLGGFLFSQAFYVRLQSSKWQKTETQAHSATGAKKQNICYFNAPSLSSAIPPIGTGDLLYQQL